MSVQKLYVIGYTSDLAGLVLSRQKGVRSGGFVLDLDAKLRRAVGEIDTLREESRYGTKLAPGDVIDASVNEEEAPAESAPGRRLNRGVLTPKEIQAELRAGRSVKEVARMAGTEVSWIERFLSPILAERKGIVDLVLAGTLSRPRRGKSGCKVGEAITANLKERSIVLGPEALDEGWSVARRNGRWEVTFRVPLRNQQKDAAFAYEPESGVTALNPMALQIGWRAPEPRPLSDDNGETDPTVGPEDPAASPPAPSLGGGPRGDPGEAVAGLWGATKPMPPTAPARRSSLAGGKAVQGGASQPGRPGGATAAGKAAQAPRSPADREQPAKRLPGPADDRPSFARGSSSRPQRLLSTADDEHAWRANLARTREARKGRTPVPEPQPRAEPPTPQRPQAQRPKRIPDDWLLGK